MEKTDIDELECCKTSELRHFVNDASILSCGHLICKTCCPSSGQIKCYKCNETNKVTLEALKMVKEPCAINILFKSNLKSIFKCMANRFDEIFEQFKEIHTLDYVEYRIELIKEEIEVRVESLKSELDSLREKLFEKAEAIKNDIKWKVEAEDTLKERSKYEELLGDIKDENNEHLKLTRELLFEYQDTFSKLAFKNDDHLKSNFNFNFEPSDFALNSDCIGKIIDKKLCDTKILLHTQKQELLTLCGFDNNTKFTLIYRATRDGFSADDFHRLCDNHSKTLVVIKSTSGYIFGGYTSQLWNHTGGYRPTVDEFIFSLTNPTNIPLKSSRVLNNKYYGIYSHSSFGPTFGSGHDVHVCSNSNIAAGSYTNLGHSYNGNTNALVGERNFMTNEIEIFKLE